MKCRTFEFPIRSVIGRTDLVQVELGRQRQFRVRSHRFFQQCNSVTAHLFHHSNLEFFLQYHSSYDTHISYSHLHACVNKVMGACRIFSRGGQIRGLGRVPQRGSGMEHLWESRGRNLQKPTTDCENNALIIRLLNVLL